MSETTSQKAFIFLTGGQKAPSQHDNTTISQQEMSQIQVSKQEAETPKQCAEISGCPSPSMSTKAPNQAARAQNCARPNNQCHTSRNHSAPGRSHTMATAGQAPTCPHTTSNPQQAE